MTDHRPPHKELNWDQVEHYLREGTPGGAAMALLETEKIFAAITARLGFPGKTADDRMVSARKYFSEYEKLRLAREAARKVRDEVTVTFSVDDVKNVLEAYYQGIKDLTKIQDSPLSLPQKLLLHLEHVLPHPKVALKRGGIGILAFFLIIYLLDITSFGRSVVAVMVSVAHFIFSWILFTALLVFGIGIIIVGSLFFFENRRKKKTKIRVED